MSYSESDLVQGFGNYSYHGDAVQTDVCFTLTDSKLRGNGAAPEELLDIEGREAVFTHPDITENSLAQINLRSVFSLSEQNTLTAIAYYRSTDTDTFNGDGSDYEACEEPANAGFICAKDDDDESVVIDQFGNPVRFNAEVDGATENSSETSQFALGGSLQMFQDLMLGSRSHRLVYGGSLDVGEASFKQRSELARLTDTRGTDGSGWIDSESFTDVDTDILHAGLFVTDTIAFSEHLDLTFSARYNFTDIELLDQINPSQNVPEGEEVGSSLNGKHHFDRINPAIAFSYFPGQRITVFGYYSQSSRAPTPAELTCANPDDPCRLPNAFVDDPPLDQVVTHTLELGVRGTSGQGLQWNAALFDALSQDDILFISDGSSSSLGYFDNVGDTQRRGLELSLAGQAGPLSYGAHYTYVSAEFQDDFLVSSPNHPLRNPLDDELPAAEAVVVSSGNRMPGVPDHLLRLNAQWDINSRFMVGANVQAQSEQYFRGDESNTAAQLDGFAVLNLNASYRFSSRAEVFARINNVLDTSYETFGVFGEAEEVLGGDFTDARRFVGPGAPLGAWIGLRITL
jgi:iron complex outermembrane receptor protein